MKSTILAATAGLLASANAWGSTGLPDTSTVWTTVVTTDFTTYCPSPTTFAYHNVTYTATSETTITVTNCPCTVSYSQPPPVVTTSYYPTSTLPGTVSVPTSIYTNGTGVPYPSGTPGSTSVVTYPGGSSTVYTYTPSPTTYISGTTVITTPTYPAGFNTSVSATNTPIAPSTVPGGAGSTTTGPVSVPTAAAGKVAPVALLAVGLAALAL